VPRISSRLGGLVSAKPRPRLENDRDSRLGLGRDIDLVQL